VVEAVTEEAPKKETIDDAAAEAAEELAPVKEAPAVEAKKEEE
jgi:hypothetical protein